MRLPTPLVHLALLVAACTPAIGDPSLTTPEPVDVPSPAPVIADADPHPSFDPDTVPEDASIELTRTNFGTRYVLKLHADGTVDYEGINEVAVSGQRAGTVSPQDFADAWHDLATFDREAREQLDACHTGARDDGSAYTVVARTGGDWIGFSGELDAACPNNQARARMNALVGDLVDAVGARAWTGSSI